MEEGTEEEMDEWWRNMNDYRQWRLKDEGKQATVIAAHFPAALNQESLSVFRLQR